MGMSASQARFLSLTARKTNVEYEGQQINQQRTALANESSNYYSQLTSLAVPTPPSSADYTKITYTFNDGSEKNTITSLIARTNGLYMLNYVQEVPQDAIVVQGTSVISRTQNPTTGHDIYRIGSMELQNINTSANLDIDTEDGLNNAKNILISSGLDKNTVNNMNEEHLTQALSQAVRERFIAAGIPSDVIERMSDEELKKLLIVENKYYALAQEKYSQDNWMVRYQLNSSTKNYEPVLYNKTELENADYNQKTTMSLTGIKNYIFGESTETQEIRNAYARVEQDSSGRYISLILYPNQESAEGNVNGTTYNLTTTTESDEAGYNDAMNQYYYDKAQYDQKIHEVNSKIEIIQVQDKNLELKLKQLDTEENAISSEVEAVKKVISKNVDSSFKTFSA